VSISAIVAWGATALTKTTVDLKDKPPNEAWIKVLVIMKTKHINRPTNKLLSFNITVDFLFARTPNGVIPEHMKPTIHKTAAATKLQQQQDKLDLQAATRHQVATKKERDELQLVNCQKCIWKHCSNNEGDQCLKYNNRHWRLDAKDISAWN
jgi:hypothetical protein